MIALLRHRAGYIEKIGTGIRRIEKAVKEHGRGNVTFSFDSFFAVSFSRVKSTRKTSGERLGERLGENCLKIISLMKENSKISRTEMRRDGSFRCPSVWTGIVKIFC